MTNMGLKERIIAECEWAIAQIDNGSISVPETRSFFGCVRRLLENEPVSPVVAAIAVKHLNGVTG